MSYHTTPHHITSYSLPLIFPIFSPLSYHFHSSSSSFLLYYKFFSPSQSESTQFTFPLPIFSTLDILEAQDPLELEESNIRLKPYLKQLNALKASLSTQLRELEDSRAFIALGISKEASEAMIKKAYHSKAIKLRTYAFVHLIIDSYAHSF